MYCSSCGVLLANGAVFCQECGQPQQQTDIVYENDHVYVPEVSPCVPAVSPALKEKTRTNHIVTKIVVSFMSFVAVAAIVFGVLGFIGKLSLFQHNSKYINQLTAKYGMDMDIAGYTNDSESVEFVNIQQPSYEHSNKQDSIQQPLPSPQSGMILEDNESPRDNLADESMPEIAMPASPTAAPETAMPALPIAAPEPMPVPYISQRVLVRNNGSGWTLELEEWFNGDWTVLMQTTAFVGKNGTSVDTKEGDRKTPAGTYKILFCYGISEPTTNLKFRKLNSDDVFVDDANSSYYNTIVSASYISTGTSHETVYKQFSDGLYNACIFFDFNGDGENANTSTSGRGSVRTLRGNTGTLKETRGDIDISSGAMSTLLAVLDSEKHPIIDIE